MAKKNVRALFEHALQAKQLQKPKAQPYEVPDELKELMSKESIGVMKHFGPDTPYLLNNYCCCLEDALIEQAKAHASFRDKCFILADEVSHLRELLSEKDIEPKGLQSDE